MALQAKRAQVPLAPTRLAESLHPALHLLSPPSCLGFSWQSVSWSVSLFVLVLSQAYVAGRRLRRDPESWARSYLLWCQECRCCPFWGSWTGTFKPSGAPGCRSSWGSVLPQDEHISHRVPFSRSCHQLCAEAFSSHHHPSPAGRGIGGFAVDPSAERATCASSQDKKNKRGNPWVV